MSVPSARASFSVRTLSFAVFVAYGLGIGACSAQSAGPVGEGVFRTERTRSADAFVDSVGVNVHLAYHDGPYGRVPEVNALVKRLGVHHLRDGVIADQPAVCMQERAMAVSGVRFTYVTQPNLKQPQLVQWAACAGPAIEAYEGPNEYDISHPGSDTNWVGTLQNFTPALYRMVKDAPTLARLPVIGPSLTSEKAWRAVGDLSSSMDYGNMHNYFAGHEPGSGGWGLDGYGGIRWNVRSARLVAGNRDIMTTETGYSSGGDNYAVDATTQGIYVPELFLEQFSLGVARTFYYQLIDEGGPPFAHYGLANANLQPKPAFNALADLIALTGTQGQTRSAISGSPETLRYALDGATESVHHLVLVRHDGTLLFAIWQAVPLYDSAAKTALAVAPRHVTLRLAEPSMRTVVYDAAADGHLRAAMTNTTPATSIDVTLSAGPTVVMLAPARR